MKLSLAEPVLSMLRYRSVPLAQSPDHPPSQTAVGSVADFCLAGVLIIVGYEIVVGRAGVVDAQVRRLRRRVPVVEVGLIIGGHDGSVGNGGIRGRNSPALAGKGGPASGGAGAAGPNVAIESNADAELGGSDAGGDEGINHPVGGGNQAASAGETIAAIVNRGDRKSVV